MYSNLHSLFFPSHIGISKYILLATRCKRQMTSQQQPLRANIFQIADKLQTSFVHLTSIELLIDLIEKQFILFSSWDAAAQHTRYNTIPTGYSHNKLWQRDLLVTQLDYLFNLPNSSLAFWRKWGSGSGLQVLVVGGVNLILLNVLRHKDYFAWSCVSCTLKHFMVLFHLL